VLAEPADLFSVLSRQLIQLTVDLPALVAQLPDQACLSAADPLQVRDSCFCRQKRSLTKLVDAPSLALPLESDLRVVTLSGPSVLFFAQIKGTSLKCHRPLARSSSQPAAAKSQT